MFDYLASGKIIISSKLMEFVKVLKHNKKLYNCGEVKYELWKKEISKILRKRI